MRTKVLRTILAFVAITLSLTLSAGESKIWIARTNFSIEGANYTETLTFISGISYALTESANELAKQQKANFFCAPKGSIIGSELLVKILSSKHSGSITAETAIETIKKGLVERFPCPSTAYNNALKSLKSLTSFAGTAFRGPLA